MSTFPKPTKVTTEWCKARLSEVFPSTNESGWKRTSKKKDGSDIVRTFEHKNGTTATARETASSVSFEADAVATTNTTLPVDIKEKLIAAASQIRHCGDGGELWLNRKTKTAYWVGGDADGEVGNGHTPFDKIEQLLKIEGIKKVEIEAECSPDEDDPNWENLGKQGIEFNVGWSFHPKTEPIQSLEPGFLMAKFSDSYDNAELIHVVKTETGSKVYSFYHHKIFEYGSNKVQNQPRILTVEKIVDKLGPEFAAAMVDIYESNDKGEL